MVDDDPVLRAVRPCSPLEGKDLSRGVQLLSLLRLTRRAWRHLFLSWRRAFEELVDVVELSQDTMLLHGLHEQGLLVGWTRLRLRTLVLVAWAAEPHSPIFATLSVSLSDELGSLLNPDDVLSMYP